MLTLKLTFRQGSYEIHDVFDGEDLVGDIAGSDGHRWATHREGGGFLGWSATKDEALVRLQNRLNGERMASPADLAAFLAAERAELARGRTA